MTPNRNRKAPSLASSAGLGFAAVLGSLLSAVLVLATSGALLGWLGMLAAGILGTSVAFLTVAWPLGVIASVILGMLRGNRN